MDQVQELLEDKTIDWKQLLDNFAMLDEVERRRFSWVAPVEDDLKWLKEFFTINKVDKLIGVGCGSGFLERIVGDYSGTID